MLESGEGITVVCQRGLRLFDRGPRVGHHRIEDGRIRVQVVDVCDVRRNGADRGDEAITDGVQVRLGGENRVRLVFRHRQGEQSGVEGARGPCAVG